MPTRRTIGVDIGGTRLLAGAVDAELGVHHRTQRAVSGLDQASLLAAAVDAIDETRDAAGAEIAAVGFAQGTHTPSGIADVMAERLGLATFSDSHANVIALAEQRAGAARGARETAVLTIGDGIAVGLILGGELQRAPETGGTELLDAIRTAVAEHPESALAGAIGEGRSPSGELVIELAHDRDPGALAALEQLGRALGETIARISSRYQLQAVVVGGAVTSAGERLFAAARAAGGDAPPIAVARFGVDAAVVGAAALAFDRLRRRGAQAA